MCVHNNFYAARLKSTTSLVSTIHHATLRLTVLYIIMQAILLCCQHQVSV